MSTREVRRQAFAAAFPLSLPVMAGYVVLGFGFGLLLRARGYGVLWPTLMSVIIYAGSMQYVAIDLMASGASLISTAIMTLLINFRHLFYGLSMLTRYGGLGRKKPYLIFALTDETYSIASYKDPPEGVDKGWFYLILSALNQSYWIVGSVLGSLFGGLGVISTQGVEFSMTALFAVIFTDQWLASRDHRPAVIGMAASVLSLVVFGRDNFIIPAMAIIAVALLLLPRDDKEREG
ncbi:MAG: branched-chain amino acid transporter AzlC [Clostridiales bacterium]|nr:branched-chain amino acid transporter AzlC [Clostridiales bacterium]